MPHRHEISLCIEGGLGIVAGSCALSVVVSRFLSSFDCRWMKMFDIMGLGATVSEIVTL